MALDYIALGRRIKLARAQTGFTQADLAILSGLTPAFIGLVELGKRKPSLETMFSFAHVLGVSLDQLLSDSTFQKRVAYFTPKPMIYNPKPKYDAFVAECRAFAERSEERSRQRLLVRAASRNVQLYRAILRREIDAFHAHAQQYLLEQAAQKHPHPPHIPLPHERQKQTKRNPPSE